MTVDYDTNAPMPVDEYRQMQANAPGADALYASLVAICEASLSPGASVLVVGAGGGAEIEALGASLWQFALTGVDPSAAMLDVARPYADAVQPAGRARLLRGTVDDLPHGDRFDAATSVMVMHFLPDDGAKAAYLAEIRARLVDGATFFHTEVSFDIDGGVERLIPVIRRYTKRAGLPDFASQFTNSDTGVFPVSDARRVELFSAAGFRIVAPVFRGLWYAGWWAEAL